MQPYAPRSFRFIELHKSDDPDFNSYLAEHLHENG
jgi:hypothetical protein